MLEKCRICRFACKTNIDRQCNFEPQKKYLGFPFHFRDPVPNHRHKRNSIICVVCKEYFNKKRMFWVKEKEGYYPMCAECRDRHYFIVKTVPRVYL